jgi:hypothetical protein
MKRFNLTKAALLIATSISAANVQAADVTLDISFTTLPEIVITEEQAISFGEVLSPSDTHTCVMDLDASTGTGGTDLAPADVGTDDVTFSAGTLTGECDTSVEGTPGIYLIDASNNADVEVTVSAGTATDIAFEPVGFIVNYQDATTTAAATAFVEGTGVDVYAASDTAGGGDDDIVSGYVADGQTRVLVAGTVTNQTSLTVGTEYTTTFDIDVLYN